MRTTCRNYQVWMFKDSNYRNLTKEEKVWLNAFDRDLLDNNKLRYKQRYDLMNLKHIVYKQE